MPSESPRPIILGAGVTGIAAGVASGCPVYEALSHAGGICASYYMRPGTRERLASPPADGEAFRFEHGGGHWIFGGRPDVLSLVQHLAPCERIARRSSVFFPDEGRYVEFPLQYHLRALEPALAARALAEMQAPARGHIETLADWLDVRFGPTLGELFFDPFHDAYTAGLTREIAPQDGYKTPLDLEEVRRGASDVTAPAGYNATFLYPAQGLDALIGALRRHADVSFAHRVVRIDPARRTVAFADGTERAYRTLLCTLPLNRTLELAGISLDEPAAPFTSVLVLNVGARRGPRCPDDHWLYVPRSHSGFHRVGFYSNVADHFVPRSDRGSGAAACLYVERSYRGGERPSPGEIDRYATEVIDELARWEFIERVDAIDASFVDVAYTWSRPGSDWASQANAMLAGCGIRMVGRYARWTFQGIADSLRDGFLAGQALRLIM